jgi:hypothetical protein
LHSGGIEITMATTLTDHDIHGATGVIDLNYQHHRPTGMLGQG